MDEAESHQNGFFHFVQALETLSLDAESQCETMGNYNTPWEIQHDVADAAILADSQILRFTQEQRDAIKELSQQLLLLPKEAIAPEGMAMTTHAGCIAGMRHPNWESLREKAKRVLMLLQPAIMENHRYLNFP